jgi:hypothetical protein
VTACVAVLTSRLAAAVAAWQGRCGHNHVEELLTGGRAPHGEQLSNVLVCMREREICECGCLPGWRRLDKDEANNLRQLA